MLTPLAPDGLNYAKAAHLLNRAAFGGAPAEIDAVCQKGLQRIVRELVDAEATNLPAPAWAQPRNIRDIRMSIREEKNEPGERKDKRREFRQMEGENILDLRRWWLDHMMTTPVPLVEKMTLFWHGHFATSVEKVKDGYWMWRQNDMLRRHAFGNFVTLTK